MFYFKTAKYIEKYSSKKNEWQPYKKLPEPRLYHSVVILDNKIYVVGMIFTFIEI